MNVNNKKDYTEKMLLLYELVDLITYVFVSQKMEKTERIESLIQQLL